MPEAREFDQAGGPSLLYGESADFFRARKRGRGIKKQRFVVGELHRGSGGLFVSVIDWRRF
jgi:hypothetical protein